MLVTSTIAKIINYVFHYLTYLINLAKLLVFEEEQLPALKTLLALALDS